MYFTLTSKGMGNPNLPKNSISDILKYLDNFSTDTKTYNYMHNENKFHNKKNDLKYLNYFLMIKKKKDIISTIIKNVIFVQK